MSNIKKLVVKDGQVWTKDGEYLFTIQVEKKYIGLLCDYWDDRKESWEEYEKRILDKEKHVRLEMVDLVKDIVEICNEQSEESK